MMNTGDIFIIENKKAKNKMVSAISIVDTNKAETVIYHQETQLKETITTERLRSLIVSKVGHSRLKAFKPGDPVSVFNVNSEPLHGVIIKMSPGKNMVTIIYYDRHGLSKRKYRKYTADARFTLFDLNEVSKGRFRIKVDSSQIIIITDLPPSLKATVEKTIIKKKVWSVNSSDRYYFKLYLILDNGFEVYVKIKKKFFISCILPRIPKEGKILPKRGDIVTIKKNVKKRGVLKGDIGKVLETIYLDRGRLLTSSKIVIKMIKDNTIKTVLLKHLKPTFKNNAKRIQNSSKIKTAEPQKNKNSSHKWIEYHDTIDTPPF